MSLSTVHKSLDGGSDKFKLNFLQKTRDRHSRTLDSWRLLGMTIDKTSHAVTCIRPLNILSVNHSCSLSYSQLSTHNGRRIAIVYLFTSHSDNHIHPSNRGGE